MSGTFTKTFNLFTDSKYNEKSETDVADVVDSAKKNIINSLNVATLGIVTNISTIKVNDNFSIQEASVSIFPETDNTAGSENQLVQAYVAQSVNTANGLSGVSVGDIVVVIFTDLNYKNGLMNIINQMSSSSKVSYDSLRHSKDYGIIVAIMYSKNLLKSDDDSTDDSSN